MKKILSIVLLLNLILSLSTPVQAAPSVTTPTGAAATKIALLIDGKAVEYTGTQVMANCNNIPIDLTKTPGILLNGWTMIPYEELFVTSPLKVKASYNKSKKTITLQYQDNKLQLTIGSKKAILNKISKSLPAAPAIIQYVKTKQTKIVIPSQTVANYLGIQYQWNPSSRSVQLTGAVNGTKPNGRSIQYDGQNYIYTKKEVRITIDDNPVKTNMPGLIINNWVMVPANAVFAKSTIQADYQYQSSNRTVTLTANNHEIVMTMGSTTAYVDGQKQTVDEPPKLIKDNSSKKSFVMVPASFTAKALELNYSWNNSTATSNITTISPDEPDIPDNKKDKPSDKKNTNTGNTNHDRTPDIGRNLEMNAGNEVLLNYISSFPDTLTLPSNPQTAASRILNAQKTDDNHMIFTFDKPIAGGSITNTAENKLILTLDNCKVSAITAQSYKDGFLTGLTGSQSKTNVSQGILTLSLAITKVKFSADLSSDRQTLTLEFKTNYMNDIVLDTTKNSDILTLTNAFGITPTTTMDSAKNILTLTFPQTTTDLKTVSKNIAGFAVSKVSMKPAENSVTVQLTLDPISNYQINTEGSATIITINKLVLDRHIALKIPSEVNISDIQVTDDYNSRRYIVTIPGNYKDFYASSNLVYNNTTDHAITSIKASINSSGNTNITITTKTIKAFLLEKGKNTLYLTVKNPKDAYKQLVVIDVGHGGSDPGTKGFGYYEKNLALEMALKLKDYMDKDTSIKAYYTRTHDYEQSITAGSGVSSSQQSLKMRYDFANEIQPDLFLSIHINSAENAGANGTETLYAPINSYKNAGGLTSKALAQIAQAKILPVIGRMDRKIKDRDGLAVLKYVKAPAILMEIGFLSNKTDTDIMTDPQKQDEIGQCLYEIIQQAFEDYPVNR